MELFNNNFQLQWLWNGMIVNNDLEMMKEFRWPILEQYSSVYMELIRSQTFSVRMAARDSNAGSTKYQSKVPTLDATVY